MRKHQIHSPAAVPSEDDIREYAYHLYVQNGCVPGRDVDNWLEARACLCACIPSAQSPTRLHQHLQRSEEKLPVPRGRAVSVVG